MRPAAQMSRLGLARDLHAYLHTLRFWRKVSSCLDWSTARRQWRGLLGGTKALGSWGKYP